MTDDEFLIKYDGGDAENNTIDMRLFGQSLIGIEKIASDFIIIASAKRFPKRGERAPLIIKANEPKIGTVNVPSIIQENIGLLQLGWQLFGVSGTDMVSNWLKTVLLHYSGRQSEAEQAMQQITDVANKALEIVDRVDERRHHEMMGMQDLLRAQLDRSNPAAVQAVSPIGYSVRRLLFFRGKGDPLKIEESDAEQIRSRAELIWSPLEPWSVKTDGFVFHTRRLSIEHPEQEGYFLAEVEDPVAETENNPYASAVQHKALIQVTAKAGYRLDRLERLVIVDFGGEIDDAKKSTGRG
jgi:hypothetical protein